MLEHLLCERYNVLHPDGRQKRDLFGKSPAVYAAAVDKVRPFYSRFVTLRRGADEYPPVPRS